MPAKRRRQGEAEEPKKKASTKAIASATVSVNVPSSPPLKALEKLPRETFANILRFCDVISATCVSITNRKLYGVFTDYKLGLGQQMPIPLSTVIADGPDDGGTRSLRLLLYKWMTSRWPHLSEWDPERKRFCSKQTVTKRLDRLKAIIAAREEPKGREPKSSRRGRVSFYELDAEEIQDKEWEAETYAWDNFDHRWDAKNFN